MITFFPNIVSDLPSLGNILFVSALAPTINDSQTRTDALGRIDRPFKSIQSALNVCAFDDVVYIFNGNYNENINCNKAIKSIILDNVIFTGTFNLSPTGSANLNKIVIQGIGQSYINSSLITLNGLTPFGIHYFEFKNLNINANYNYDASETQRTVSYFDCTLNQTADYSTSTFFVDCYRCKITAEGKNKSLLFHRYFNCDITYQNGKQLGFTQSTLYAENCKINFGDFLFTQTSPIINLTLINCDCVVGILRQMTGYGNFSPQTLVIRNTKITETSNPNTYMYECNFVSGDWYLGGTVNFNVNYVISNKPFFDPTKLINVVDKTSYLTIQP